MTCDALIRCANTEAPQQRSWLPTRTWERCFLKIDGNVLSIYLENSLNSTKERSFALAVTSAESYSPASPAEKAGLPQDGAFALFTCAGILIGPKKRFEKVVLAALEVTEEHFLGDVMRNCVKLYRIDDETSPLSVPPLSQPLPSSMSEESGEGAALDIRRGDGGGGDDNDDDAGDGGQSATSMDAPIILCVSIFACVLTGDNFFTPHSHHQSHSHSLIFAGGCPRKSVSWKP